MSPRAVYRGRKRKLVLAFDVGLTHSGISYSVLDPGQVPEIKPVTRFPAHEHISGASKIPSIIYYDRSGKVKAVGAEALTEKNCEKAETENWIKSEWFRLHLRNRIGAGINLGHIPPLPLNKTVVDVFADFLKYLLSCAETYIKDTHANGPSFWDSMKHDIDFVLSHPNGWGGTQQQEMRKAAVAARLIPDTSNGHARLSFVTEGEASLHFAIQNGLPIGTVKDGDGLVIVDAGADTIDISFYCRSTGREGFDEVAAPRCHFYGSAVVTIYARMFLNNFLEESPFLDDLEHIVKCFDKTTKPRFRDSKDNQYIKFGSTRDNDEKHNIRLGQLKLQGSDVAMFFEPSINCIVKGVRAQKAIAHKSISMVFLIGTFAASDWLYINVNAQLESLGMKVIRPSNHANKAVSDGAISFYLDSERFANPESALANASANVEASRDGSKETETEPSTAQEQNQSRTAEKEASKSKSGESQTTDESQRGSQTKDDDGIQRRTKKLQTQEAEDMAREIASLKIRLKQTELERDTLAKTTIQPSQTERTGLEVLQKRKEKLKRDVGRIVEEFGEVLDSATESYADVLRQNEDLSRQSQQMKSRCSEAEERVKDERKRYQTLATEVSKAMDELKAAEADRVGSASPAREVRGNPQRQTLAQCLKQYVLETRNAETKLEGENKGLLTKIEELSKDLHRRQEAEGSSKALLGQLKEELEDARKTLNLLLNKETEPQDGAGDDNQATGKTTKPRHQGRWGNLFGNFGNKHTEMP